MLTSEKIAVFVPMPSASDSTAAAVTNGAERSERQATFRSRARCHYKTHATLAEWGSRADRAIAAARPTLAKIERS